MSLFGDSQLALDATLVSALHGNGIHRRHADKADGIVLREARRRKERTYPELQGRNGRVRMVVIAGEVGGKWSEETQGFLWCLACEKSRSEPKVFRKSVRVAWYRRWCCLLVLPRQRQLFCRSWSVEESQVLGMIHPLPTRWWRPHSARCSFPCSGLTVHISFARKKEKREKKRANSFRPKKTQISVARLVLTLEAVH